MTQRNAAPNRPTSLLRRLPTALLGCALALFVAACGATPGAGPGADPDDQNRPPSEIALSNASVLADRPAGEIVGVFTTVDVDDQEHTYRLTAGAAAADNAAGNDDDNDNDRFSLDGATLRTAAPLDAGDYRIRVVSRDAAGGAVEGDFSIRALASAPSDDVIVPGSRIGDVGALGDHGDPYLQRGPSRIRNTPEDRFYHFDDRDYFVQVCNATDRVVRVHLGSTHPRAAELATEAGIGLRSSRAEVLDAYGDPDDVTAVQDYESLAYHHPDGTVTEFSYVKGATDAMAGLAVYAPCATGE